VDKRVIWSERAKASLEYYCNCISESSQENSNKVRKEIIQSAKMLSKYPEMYQVDEYYPNNSGSIRRFFKWSYRIVYQVRDTSVLIINIYHTKVDPHNIA